MELSLLLYIHLIRCHCNRFGHQYHLSFIFFSCWPRAFSSCSPRAQEVRRWFFVCLFLLLILLLQFLPFIKAQKEGAAARRSGDISSPSLIQSICGTHYVFLFHHATHAKWEPGDARSLVWLRRMPFRVWVSWISLTTLTCTGLFKRIWSKVAVKHWIVIA